MSTQIRPLAPVHTRATSYHNINVTATAEQLIALFGQPAFDGNLGEDKVNLEWHLQIDGRPFTIYDWKYYRPLELDEMVDWHIGAHNNTEASAAAAAIVELLDQTGEPEPQHNPKHNPYLDINWIDRTEEVQALYDKTVADIKVDPGLYAELVNDLLFHWIHGTKETPLMNMFKQDILNPR